MMFEFRDISPKYVACAACAAATGVGFVLYKTLRPQFSIKVNCWFCNKDSIVPYGNKNCWDCMHCDQYNGFREDGDYNKPIPAQYTEEFNYPISAVQKKEVRFKSELLCAECNRNQLLKISQLANFVPISEAYFDQEIEAFRHNLEHIYRLCPNCERSANHRIEQQDRRLERKYGVQRPQSPTSSTRDVSTISNRSARSDCSDHHLLCHLRAPFHIRLLRFLTMLCAAVLFIVNLHNLQKDAKVIYVKFPQMSIRYIELVFRSAAPLLVFGPLTALAAMFLHGPDSVALHADVLHLVFWMIFCPLQANWIPFKREDSFLLRTLCAFFMVILAVWCWLCKRTNVQQSPIRIVKKRLRDSPASSLMTNSRTNSPNPSQNGEIRTASDFSNFSSVNQRRQPDDGPLNKLGTMSLGPPSNRKKASSVFNTSNSQVTSTTNPLMSSLSKHTQKRPLISPARFKGSPSQPSLQKSASWPPKILPSRQPTWVDSGSIPVNESVSAYGDTQSQLGDRHSDGSTSTNSSVCPVDTTCQYVEENVATNKHGGKTSIFKEYIFAFSLAVNILIITFMFLNWNVVQGFFSIE